MIEKILLIGLGIIFLGVVAWMYWWENGGNHSSKDDTSSQEESATKEVKK